MSGEIKGTALAAATAGGVLIYSGLKGKGVLQVIQGVVQGKSPATAPQTNPINTPGGDPTSSGGGGSGSGGGSSSSSGASGFFEGIGAGGIPSTGTSHKAYFDAVLQGINAPITRSNELALASVATLEGINKRFNPLNSVIPSGNSTPFNSVGVQDYHSFQNGVNGTIALLNGAHWNNVRGALQHNAGLNAVLSAFKAAYTWDPGVNFSTNELQLQNTLNQPTGP